MERLAVILLCLTLPLPSAAENLTVTRVIPAGTVLSEADIGSLRSETEPDRSALFSVIGKEARVTLYPGRPLTLAHLSAPTLVDRNQIVTLIFHSNTLQIVTEGRALGRAGAGEQIRIINNSSRQTVSGVVQQDGTVIVGVGE